MMLAFRFLFLVTGTSHPAAFEDRRTGGGLEGAFAGGTEQHEGESGKTQPHGDQCNRIGEFFPDAASAAVALFQIVH